MCMYHVNQPAMGSCTVSLTPVIGSVLKPIRVDGDQDVDAHGVEEVRDGCVDVVFCH